MDSRDNIKNILDELIPILPQWDQLILVFALVGDHETPVFCCNLQGIESDLDNATRKSISTALEGIKSKLSWQRIKDQESGNNWFGIRIRTSYSSNLVEVTTYPAPISDKNQVRKIANIET